MSNDAFLPILANAARGMGDGARALSSMMTGTTIMTRMRGGGG
jgi:hypothetical protein